MDVPEILTALAARIATVPGIKSAHYPAPNTIEAAQLPAVVLYWGGDTDTVIDPDMDGQMWTVTLKAELLGPRKGNTPVEFARIDRLITPVVDAINRPGPVSAVLADLSGHVDRLFVTRVRPTLSISYGDATYYGAELYLTAKFHRYEELP